MNKIRGLPPEVREPGPGVELGVEDGLLSQLIHSPEFNLFSNSAVFESHFVQVTESGNWMNVYGGSTTVILGVTSSVPSLPLPNILLMAKVIWPRGQFSPCSTPGYAPVITLSRILPLKFVELQIFDRLKRILRIRTVTEKIYYMRLHEKYPETVFQFWIRLVEILQKGLSITTKDPRIQFTHCLVPKKPSGCPEMTPESSLLSSTQSNENAMLCQAEQTSDRFSNMPSWAGPGNYRPTEDSNPEFLGSSTRNTDIKGFNKSRTRTSTSPVTLHMPMRAILSHSLWEQDNSDFLPQPPIASSLGEHLLGP